MLAPPCLFVILPAYRILSIKTQERMNRWLFLLTLACLTCITHAQAQQGKYCTQGEAELGGLRSHEMYCGLFYQCLPDRRAVEMVCPEGLLYDDVSGVCAQPAVATCLNKQCYGNDVGVTWPHICCDRYIGCNEKGELYFGKCLEGEVYDSQKGGCVTGASCKSHPRCSRLNAVPTSEPTPCRRRAVANDPCKFQEFDEEGNDLGIQNCGMGTSFRAQTCNCGNHDESCGGVKTPTQNRVLDPQCRATMVMDFSGRVPTSYTLKTASGQRMANSYAIGAWGYTSANNEGIFASTAAGEKAKLYLWSFVRNMLLGPFGIKIAFQVDNPQEGYSFTLIGNDLTSIRPDCEGTLDIKATYRNGQWTIAIKVVAYNSATGQRTPAEAVQTVNGGNGYITVSFIYTRWSRTMYGYVITQGSNPVSWGPVNLAGDLIDINNCGLALAYGLEGRLRQVEFYEACGDEDILRSKLQ